MARLDETALVFIEGVFADLEEGAGLALRQFQLRAHAPDRGGRRHALDFLLERAKGFIDHAYVLADMYALAFPGGIVAWQVDRDRLALIRHDEGTHAAPQDLSGFRRVHGLGENFLFRRHDHFSLNDINVNSVTISAWNFT